MLPVHSSLDHVAQGIPLGQPDTDSLQGRQQGQDLLQRWLLGAVALRAQPHAWPRGSAGHWHAARVEEAPAELTLDHGSSRLLLAQTHLELGVLLARQHLHLVRRSQGTQRLHLPQPGFSQRGHLKGGKGWHLRGDTAGYTQGPLCSVTLQTRQPFRAFNAGMKQGWGCAVVGMEGQQLGLEGQQWGCAVVWLQFPSIFS